LLRRRSTLTPLLAISLAALAVVPAQASRAPTGSEEKAIKKAFLQGRAGDTEIRRIRVSTVDEAFAAVSYAVTIEDPTSSPRSDAAIGRRGGTKTPAPTPVILKEKKGGKWKTVPTAPDKVKKDLKVKDPKSDIQVSGDHSASLTRAASCSDGGGAGIYDPGTDTFLDIQFHGNYWKGPGAYPALSVGSVAGLYGTSGQVLVFETGQPNDAFASSGVIYVDRDGWGLIDAYMSPAEPGSSAGNNVLVRGYWVCR
jgi:hypothetical protein